MLSYCLEDPVWSWDPPFNDYRILPDDSIVFAITPQTQYANLNKYLIQIPQVSAKYIFIEDTSDPVIWSTDYINNILNIFQQRFPQSRVIFLSANTIDYYNQNSSIIWYPKWFLSTIDTSKNTKTRVKRIGCLNRRPCDHRSYLMHNLLSHNLLDHERDIFSIIFTDEFYKKLDQSKYPLKEIATIMDGFTNDHTIMHPAWQTALCIVSETEVNDNFSILSEKTLKAITSESCWISHCGQYNLTVLNDLGFDTSMFKEHASGTNIQPIIDMCNTLDNESTALDYYYSKISIIEHNKEWLLTNKWIEIYLKKLGSIL